MGRRILVVDTQNGLHYHLLQVYIPVTPSRLSRAGGEVEVQLDLSCFAELFTAVI